MADLRIGYTLIVSLLLLAVQATAADRSQTATVGLYDWPVLVIDRGMHTAAILRADADAEGRYAVTGSDDKTVRIWSLAEGTLQRTIRLPAGPGNVGRVYTVAMSPDGALIAVGGWTRVTEADQQEQIYVFDWESGKLVERIDGLQTNVRDLAFSPDGRRLAAALGGYAGFGSLNYELRVYDRVRGWAEVARDMETVTYSENHLTFARDGRLAVTVAGTVRLYSGDLAGHVQPVVAIAASGGRQPNGIAFSPDGSRLAVGYWDSTAVTLLDARTLALLPGPDMTGIDNGGLSQVAWSRDGRTLFAAGTYRPTLDDGPLVLSWSDAGAGARRALQAGRNTVFDLVPLPEGDLLAAAADPWLGRLQADGRARWVNGPPKVDFSDQFDKLAVSNDGTRIDFDFEPDGRVQARFDLATRTLTLDPLRDGRMALPRQSGLPIVGWRQGAQLNATLGGLPLPLYINEKSHSLAVHPAGDRFVLGTSLSLRAIDASGKLIWTHPAPSVTWAVNITGDGRLVVAAYHDGTIRWHRMTDGVELLAFMPLPDQVNWVAWTPEGFYAATAGAQGVLRWHINRGWDAAADSVPVADIPGSYRPALLPLVLQELETDRALGLAMMAEHRHEVMFRTNSQVPPGVRLHLLTVGISAYNEDYAKSLRLRYADKDANDLASAIVNTQSSLYQVQPQVLLNKDASKSGIIRALKVMRAGMQAGGGNDLAVVDFSGHGAMVDRKLYLLPYDVDARDDAGIESSGLSADNFRGELLELAKYGRVLVLLDACHSGATTMTGAGIAVDADALRTGLAEANVTVLTSSRGNETSEEREIWQHGAFTKALLDAFNDPTADTNRNGLISTTGLAAYLAKRVPMLTAGKQTPGMEVRFDTTLFASGS